MLSAAAGKRVAADGFRLRTSAAIEGMEDGACLC